MTDDIICICSRKDFLNLFVTAGGLLFTSHSINMQYTTTAALLLFIYSKTLSSSGLTPEFFRLQRSSVQRCNFFSR
jgi:hypothetical protein